MEGRRAELQAWIAERAGAGRARLSGLAKLSGGAIQENWAAELHLDGVLHPVVIRTDAPSGVAVSHGRAQEFALFKAAHEAGVTVPEPLWLETSGTVTGRPFFVMRRARGTAAGHRLVKEENAGLAEALGRELARIHRIRPPRPDLAFLEMPEGSPALHLVGQFRAWLDRHRAPQPVLEWGLRWLELNAPARGEVALCHNDFRTGNYMVEAGRLTAVLDWEFAAWGDPVADIGWLCAPCWRFGARDREVGGIGAREDLYRGYEAESGRPLDRAAVPYWEVMATLRWAIIALQQAERHVSGGETSIELALTAHVVPELELDVLELIDKAS